MTLNSEKLVNYIITQLEITQREILANTRNRLNESCEEELSYLATAIDELRGYKFALEDILDALPNFEQK